MIVRLKSIGKHLAVIGDRVEQIRDRSSFVQVLRGKRNDTVAIKAASQFKRPYKCNQLIGSTKGKYSSHADSVLKQKPT